jgi:hypothetical protein
VYRVCVDLVQIVSISRQWRERPVPGTVLTFGQLEDDRISRRIVAAASLRNPR